MFESLCFGECLFVCLRVCEFASLWDWLCLFDVCLCGVGVLVGCVFASLRVCRFVGRCVCLFACLLICGYFCVFVRMCVCICV